MVENIISKINKKRYDHLFRIVFNDRKELLSLYNALADKDYTNPDDLMINTLEDAVFLGMKNDLSFIINDYLNLYEHQSTVCGNLPLRGLFYFSDIYKSLYYEDAIYRKAQIKILTPIFVVFYNGLEEVPDNYDVKLSEAFINPTNTPDVEIVAHVKNINYGHNSELYHKCKKLEEYSIFVDRVHKALKDKSKAEYPQLLVTTIDSCINDSILADILRKERGRIMESVLSHFDADEYVNYVKKEGYEEGYNSGGLNTTIMFFLENHITKDLAMMKTHLSEAEFDEAVERYKASNTSQINSNLM